MRKCDKCGAAMVSERGNHLYDSSGLKVTLVGVTVNRCPQCGNTGVVIARIAQLNRTGQAVIADLRVKVFRHMQSLDVAWFDRNPSGSLVTRVTTDIESLNELFTSGLVVLLMDCFKIVGIAAILFTIHAKLAMVVIAMLPVLVAISLAFRGGARNAHRAVRARLSRLNGYLQEVLSGIRVVQVFGRERRVSKRFSSLLDDYLSANVQTILMFALFYPMIDFAVTGIQASTVWVGGKEIAGAALSFGSFFQFWLYVNMLLNPVRQLGERYNVLQSAFASAERVFHILDTRSELVVAGDNARVFDASNGAGHVRFENVSFAYDQGVPVLDDVSFEIRPGQTVAAVGATGAGKSTLVNLLLRFYDPTAGRITIDGVDLREYDLSSLRHHISLVFQEDFLFVGSVLTSFLDGLSGGVYQTVTGVARGNQLLELGVRLGIDLGIGNHLLDIFIGQTA